MNWEATFYELLTSESEASAIRRLKDLGLWDDASCWRDLGDNENNFSIVNNQQTDATGALVEKLINAIDAMLMAGCYRLRIDPEGPGAPRTMAEAAETFFGIAGGRLGDLTPSEQTEMARAIQVVAVGAKAEPSYLLIDAGEGQSPSAFPDTFCSLSKSNKLRIPFVQGKYNAGGTGVLQFCGTENLQLIASRRHPAAPRGDDPTADHWGFTVIRRLEPFGNRKSSSFAYLAPNGQVPSFPSPSVSVLPSDTSSKNQPATAYTGDLEHGTVIKLYNYRWSARSTATTDARFELEKYLHAPTLPFRITETRDYRANYYSTTVSGIWASIDAEASAEPDSRRVEEGYPAPAKVELSSVGPLHYKIVAFKDSVDPRRVPTGVFFTVNGQVHGALPSDFVSRRLEFEYLKDSLFVSVDCTSMKTRASEDFFLASRDRLRRGGVYSELYDLLKRDLKGHAGLRQLNSVRRARSVSATLEEQSDVQKTLDELLERDPALRALFGLGDRLVTKVAPADTEEFNGQRFPTFFRIAGDPKFYSRECPTNRTVRIEFETDAVNDYFDRDNSPGSLEVDSVALLEYQSLWNGIFATRWQPPAGASLGDVIPVTVTVNDPDRAARGLPPFVSTFDLLITGPSRSISQPGGAERPSKPGGGKKRAPRLALPVITEVLRKDWGKHDFGEFSAFRVRRNGAGGFDYLVNMENGYLVSEITRPRADQDVIRYWFKWGLALCAMGALYHRENRTKSVGFDDGDDLEQLNSSLDGIAAVIVPIIRNLYRGPG